MNDWFHALLLLLFEAFAGRRDARVRFLKLQVEILRKKIPGDRVIIDPADRKRLLELGAAVGHEVQDILELVSLKTYKHWVLEQRRGRPGKRVGRPAMGPEVRVAIVRLATENLSWGVNRIIGELKKLQVLVGRTSVRRVLVEEGLHPDPRRKAMNRHAPDGAWQAFLNVNLNAIVACDFLCKTVVTPWGKKTGIVLMFIHLGSRKVFLSPSTYNPDQFWMTQQARNAAMWLEDNGVPQHFILRDNDLKYPEAFDRVFEARGVEVIRTPIAAPNANAFAESWIGKFKMECLNYFMCFGLSHLDYLASSYAVFHNEFRPHQSKGQSAAAIPRTISNARPAENRGH